MTIYFVSHGAEVGRATTTLRFAGPGEIRGRVVSPPTTGGTLNLETLGVREHSGTGTVTNWFIIARDTGGRIVALKGSDPSTQSELEAKVRAGTVR